MSKKYEYIANNFTHANKAITVCVSVAPSNFSSMPIFTFPVSVEKKDGEDIEYYRVVAIMKAKDIIIDIAKEAAN
ncbi:DUF1327 domain-containing protein [Proteus mirabilis]|uniref:DUF1327 domain-containing protein n=1 Tax=Proteus mirabilis TaxID=584 RepID=UPI000EF987E0|nr:DUF1327 domain-containing protein [Proteus mirabilis]RLZ27847.1 DUF1327 domain-containing protein [Proteus mirabilis]